MSEPDSAFVVEMISIGDELLSGAAVDTNGAVLGRFLAPHDLTVRYRLTVPDDVDAISAALDETTRRADAVVVSGGLGPTTDDVTREAVAQVLGVEMAIDLEAADRVRSAREARGMPFDERERRMATLPRGVVPLVNSEGVAPGLAFTRGRAQVICLPGVPAEFEAMLGPAVTRWLASRPAPTDSSQGRRSLTVTVFGLSELELDTRLRALERPPQVRLHYRAQPAVVQVTLVATGDATSDERWSALTQRLREAIGEDACVDGDTPLAQAVVDGLARRGLRLAVAESCTGGLVAHMLTEIPGVSEQFRLGLVTYANATKQELLDVPGKIIAKFGAVSSATVLHMATGARVRAGADLAVATSGIAGPGGGTQDKPVGTVFIALVDGKGGQWVERHFHGSRSRVKLLAAHTALDLVRRYCTVEDGDAKNRWGDGERTKA